MVEAFLDFALGPYIGAVGDFYFENQVILNSIVVAAAFIKIFSSRKRKAQNESAS
ncbi:hypothetical protein ACFO3D_05345 [Virgibacillus kekensis]|uniref:Uncharacterized protein n=1 Tax=Virgibacillus kekensis TaxID=202261 RepID=A0ABV9DFT7_9BACI